MKVRCLILDVDGVMTEGGIIYTAAGDEIKVFNSQDGLGLALARRGGLKLAVITGRYSKMVEHRTEELKFDFVRMACHNKTAAINELAEELGISTSEMAYMGDDLNDLGALHTVGYPMAPANGVAEVKAVAKFIASKLGGHGAVREAIEHIFKENGRWDELVEDYKNEIYSQGQ